MIIHDDGVGGYRPAPAWEPLKLWSSINIMSVASRYSATKSTSDTSIKIFLIKVHNDHYSCKPWTMVYLSFLLMNLNTLYPLSLQYWQSVAAQWIFDAASQFLLKMQGTIEYLMLMRGLERMQGFEGSSVHMLLLWDQWALVTCIQCIPHARVMIMSMDIVLGWRTAV